MGNPLTVHGYSLHRELALMVETGLPPRQALTVATSEAGRFLGKGWGLEEGDEGTVFLLDASPLGDITTARTADRRPAASEAASRLRLRCSP